MTNEIEALYQKIGQHMVSLIEVEFSDLWLYAAAAEGWVRSGVYYKACEGRIYKLSTRPDSDLILDLWEASSKSGDNWDEMTFHVTSEGDFEASFEYDVPEEALHDFDRPRQWIKKTLGDVEINESPSQES